MVYIDTWTVLKTGYAKVTLLHENVSFRHFEKKYFEHTLFSNCVLFELNTFYNHLYCCYTGNDDSNHTHTQNSKHMYFRCFRYNKYCHCKLYYVLWHCTLIVKLEYLLYFTTIHHNICLNQSSISFSGLFLKVLCYQNIDAEKHKRNLRVHIFIGDNHSE